MTWPSSECNVCYAVGPAEYPEPGAGFGMVKCVMCGHVWSTDPEDADV